MCLEEFKCELELFSLRSESSLGLKGKGNIDPIRFHGPKDLN